MSKEKDKAGKFVLISLIMLFIITTLGLFWFEASVKKDLTEQAEEIFKVKVKIGGIDVSYISQTARLKNVTLYNPAGYSDKEMAIIKDIRVSAVDFRAPVLELNTVFINDVAFYIEEDKDKNNFSVFLESLHEAGKDLEKERSEDKGFILRDLRISNIRVIPGSSLVKNMTETVIVTPVYLENIGLRKTGKTKETINMLMAHVMNQVFKDLRRAHFSSGLSSIKKSAIDLGDAIKSGAASLSSDMGDGLKGLGAQIGEAWDKASSEEAVE